MVFGTGREIKDEHRHQEAAKQNPKRLHSPQPFGKNFATQNADDSKQYQTAGEKPDQANCP